MKLLKSLIGIFVIFLLVLGAVQFKKSSHYQDLAQNVSNLWETIKYKLGIVKHNISEDIAPQRKRPFSLMRKEDKLKMFMPQVFTKFSRKDWEQFWDLIFGHKRVGEGLIKQKVQRSREEIEEYLKYQYYDYFYNFQKNHWNSFWNIVLGRDD